MTKEEKKLFRGTKPQGICAVQTNEIKKDKAKIVAKAFKKCLKDLKIKGVKISISELYG